MEEVEIQYMRGLYTIFQPGKTTVVRFDANVFRGANCPLLQKDKIPLMISQMAQMAREHGCGTRARMTWDGTDGRGARGHGRHGWHGI